MRYKINSAELKEHVANHFKQLALTSMNRDESPLENDEKPSDSQPWDDTMSEVPIKLEALKDLVNGQYDYLFPEDREIAENEHSLSSNAVEQQLSEQELQDISTPGNTKDGRDRDTILTETTTPLASDRWAQLR